jgi:hypothetical protein
MIAYFGRLYLGNLQRHKHVEVYHGERVIISGAEEAVQVDGDITATLPVQISDGNMPITILVG